jgi:hypothetical protein
MNAIDKWVTTATIHDEPRRALWSLIFPGATVPIKSILTSKASLPGHENADVYFLDLDAITQEQRDGLIVMISTHFRIPLEEVRSELEMGVPILAEGVSVSSADQGLVFSLMFDDGELSDTYDEFERDDGRNWLDEDDCN